MHSPVVTAKELVTGERMEVDEFLRRWEPLPDLKRAELIDGVVYVPLPLSLEHADPDMLIHWWLAHYAQATPGCRAASNGTWLMLDSAPQPDACQRILPAYGGQSSEKTKLRRRYGAGAPELAVEVCLTSTEVDFGPKLKLYQRAGVQEYITAEVFSKRIIWRILVGGVYAPQEASLDGILRSQVFPGLWLDAAALWANDGARMLAALNAGLASDDHQYFVRRWEELPDLGGQSTR
jgi:Uma2 family endonuclease